ncbi:hypothetical protein KCW65_21940, partial [Mycobacterium tuberculosis]|nr:hypothetical protein [Mycobacterium tuberculosis]
TLAGGRQAHRAELLDGTRVLVGIDKFLSEARALTNFTGNAVATLLIGRWTKELDLDQARAALNGSSPFDELSLDPENHGGTVESPEAEAPASGSPQSEAPASGSPATLSRT